MKVVIFDDVLFRSQARYRVPGLEIVFYEHADEVLEVLSREAPDVVFMDFTMDAARSGEEAVLLLRADARFASLRVVAISADREHNLRLLRAGASDSVPKTHLRAYLRRLLDQQRMAHHLR
jgi:CheY-like chemotaxis protein